MDAQIAALDQPLSTDESFKDKMLLLLLLDGSLVTLHTIVLIHITSVVKPVQFFTARSRVFKSFLKPQQQVWDIL